MTTLKLFSGVSVNFMWSCSKSSFNRKIYSNTILPQETRKISNKQPYLTPKATRERTTTKLVEGKKS